MTAIKRQRHLEKPTPKRVRLSFMESLGFFDAPSQQTSVYQAPRPTNRRAHHDKLADLLPQEVSPWLNGTGLRWGMIGSFLVILTVVAGVGWYLLQRPAVAERSARENLEASASALIPALDGVAPVITAMREGSAEIGSVTAASLALDTAARDLFNAAAELLPTLASERSTATTAATAAMEASRRLSDAVAFDFAVRPVLVLPLLADTSAEADLSEMTEIFVGWRTRFESVQLALPGGVMERVHDELERVSGRLGRHQTSYLDAVRLQDDVAMGRALNDLGSDLRSINDALSFARAVAADEIAASMSEARSRVASLLPR